MRLIPIQRGGKLEEDCGSLPADADSVLLGTSRLYEAAGFEPPWICYLAVTGGKVVGTCGFKAAPVDGKAEIAYFTFSGHDGKGIATQMARQLLRIARDTQHDILLVAQTLPERNASHRVLEKLGFRSVGLSRHPEDGVVLEWQSADRVT